MIFPAALSIRRDVFCEARSTKLAMRIYDHFAHQVLSAEKEYDNIQLTMRAAVMPFGLEVLRTRSRAKAVSQVRAVASVFRFLLAGLPGGVLGSPQLYKTLTDICHRRFSESEFNDGRTYLGGVTPAESRKVYAITLAILAMASEMQLELICAVFGLCAILLHETDRTLIADRGCSDALAGLPDVDRLSRFFGPVLLDFEDALESLPVESAERTEREAVAAMLIENWRNVSRLLNVWAAFGYPARRATTPWTPCASAGR